MYVKHWSIKINEMCDKQIEKNISLNLMESECQVKCTRVRSVSPPKLIGISTFN